MPHLDVLGIIRFELSLARSGAGADRGAGAAAVEKVYEAAELPRHVVAQVTKDVASDVHARPHRFLRDVPHLPPLPGAFGDPNQMQVLTLVGNRPQFVKAAAVSGRLRRRHDEVLVHSGQHYDDELSAVFFRELALPPPDRQLGVGSGTTDEQVTGIMHALEAVLREGRPDIVLVYGDTN